MIDKPGLTPGFAPPRASQILSLAALAGVSAAAVLSAVVLLFQSRGEPMETLAAAERDCYGQMYASQRQACVDELLANWRGSSTAV